MSASWARSWAENAGSDVGCLVGRVGHELGSERGPVRIRVTYRVARICRSTPTGQAPNRWDSTSAAPVAGDSLTEMGTDVAREFTGG
ncbi:hypothetical protein V6N11_070680 [Hibiscus sabdariffa]|uniref:Uncharacterized protein n=1 Tax=Hibiscus sabdariffa TaxID=183260 RepID=A0ABR2QFZ8_9ROSI